MYPVRTPEAERRARLLSTIGLTVLPPVLLVLVIIAVLLSRTQPVGNGARRTTQPSPTATVKPTPTDMPAFPTPEPPPYTFAAQWQNAPFASGNVASVVFSPKAPQIGYVCNVSGFSPGAAQPLFGPTSPHWSLSGLPAIFTTTDGGLEWSPAGGVAFGQPPSCRLRLDPDNPQSLYVITGVVGATIGSPSSAIWHTPDGGQTWNLPLNIPAVPHYSPVVSDLEVSGTRLVALVGGTDPNAGADRGPTLLEASDDGGQTWHDITPALTFGGKQLSVTGPLVSMGATLVLGAGATIAGAAASLDPAGGLSSLDTALAPSRQQGSVLPDTRYFVSANGGGTWSALDMPAQLSANLTFTRAANGTTYFGAVTAAQISEGGQAATIPYFSGDAGRTWTALPALRGLENGYVDPFTSSPPLAVTANGVVLIGTNHTDGIAGIASAGVFMAHAFDVAPTWQPLAYDPQVSVVQAATAPGSTRIWGLRLPTNGILAGTLVYLDLS